MTQLLQTGLKMAAHDPASQDAGQAGSQQPAGELEAHGDREPRVAALVGDVVERACIRAGLPHIGPHRMRHALATELLAGGVALSDISQVLRHRDLATTAIYAKVDFTSLRGVAREWPGESR